MKMATETPPDEADDTTLVRRIADRRDERDTCALDALKTLMARYAPRVTGHLRTHFANQLHHLEPDQVVDDAALRVWNSAGSFDPARPGGFGPWFLTIAHNCAIDLLRGEEGHAEIPEGHDPEDRCDDESLAPSPETEWRIQQMDDIIENELKGFEQVVARADLAAGGSADSRRLADLHGKTIGTVETTRSKVRKKLRTRILEREAQRPRQKGKK
jgi:RNA polymerase sigma-70 factor (ECF subfamily)